ncbi:MAG: FISUMP domain-containing protein [Alistipes sp.]
MNRLTLRILKTWMAFVFPMLLTVACSKDNDQAELHFAVPAVYLPGPATTVTVDFWTVNTADVSVFSAPVGWTIKVDVAASKLSITSPAAEPIAGAEKPELSGVVTLYVYPTSGTPSTASLYVSQSTLEDLSSQQSNCYILSKADCSYSIPVRFKGETNEPLETVSVGLVWQSNNNLIRYIQMKDDKVSFYVAATDAKKLIEGNALLAAYDTNGAIIWTWHLWITDYTPATDGRYMSRNLGAGSNKTETTDAILASYGLYYQWGRKEPFIGPLTYNCASGVDARMYDALGTRLTLTYAETSATVGTTAYAQQHPLVYILGTEASGYDWLTEAHKADLWGTTKTLNDPCPKGWHVPAQADFVGLTIADSHTAADTDKLKKQYGWTLTNGTNSSFFLGAGRRSALHGFISNVNTNNRPEPWIGCYWTSGTAADNASTALYFTLDTEDASKSELNLNASYPRANGMQIRCVKD